MNKKRISVICFTFFLIMCMSLSVLSVSTDKAKELIDTSHPCSLKIMCRDTEGKPVENVSIKLYYIASVSEDMKFTVSDELASCSIDITGIKSTARWNTVMQTADAFITADNIAPKYKLTTDKDGNAQKTELEQGIYYAVVMGTEESYTFPSYMLSLPALSDDGIWVYDVRSLPKTCVPEEPEGTEMKVVKQWMDDSAEFRPQTVSVDILCDGSFYETVTLGAENNWCCNWKSDEAHEWKAVERNVPEKYSVQIEKDGNTIVITNIYQGENPQTGISETGIEVLMMIVFAAGTMILLLGILFAKKRKNEKE